MNISELISDKDKILGINVLDTYISELKSETEINTNNIELKSECTELNSDTKLNSTD